MVHFFGGAAAVLLTIVGVVDAIEDVATTVSALSTSSAESITTSAGVCDALTASGECAASRIVGGQDVCPAFRCGYCLTRKRFWV